MKTILVASATLVACASFDASVRARHLATEALACDAVALEPRGEAVWHAEGCGRAIDVACTTAHAEPQCTRVRLRTSQAASRSDASMRAAPEDAVPSRRSREPSGETRGPSGETREQALRTVLEARRQDVLACVERDRVAVRARWDAQGAVTLALLGDLAGSPEEGCVRAALDDFRAPPGEPGEIVHLLRR